MSKLLCLTLQFTAYLMRRFYSMSKAFVGFFGKQISCPHFTMFAIINYTKFGVKLEMLGLKTVTLTTGMNRKNVFCRKNIDSLIPSLVIFL